MVTLQSAKVLIAGILIIIAVAMFAFFMYIGSSPMSIALVYLSLAAIAYLAYAFSDRLTVALTGASSRDVPAPISSAIRQYCDREHMRAPRIAIICHHLPDVYVDGIGKRKKVVMITSGAIGLLNESEICDLAIRELAYAEAYKAFDMAAYRLIMTPVNKMYEMSLNRRHMQNDRKLAWRLNEHAIVRNAEDKDFLRMYRMGIDAFREPTEFISLHMFAYRYKRPAGICLIAEYDGQPAGFAIGRIKQGTGGIYGRVDIVAVDAQYRGKGLGKGLTESFMRALEGYGCRHCCLEVWEHNDPAIRLYEKAGFEKRAVMKDFYKKGQHALVMCKKLT